MYTNTNTHTNTQTPTHAGVGCRVSGRQTCRNRLRTRQNLNPKLLNPTNTKLDEHAQY